MTLTSIPWILAGAFALAGSIGWLLAKLRKNRIKDLEIVVIGLRDIISDNYEAETKKTKIREEHGEKQDDIRNSNSPHDDGLQNRTVRSGKFGRSGGDDTAS